MKTLVTRRTIIIAAIAVLIAVSTIVSVNVWDSAGPVTGIANTISRPLRALASTVAGVFENIYNSIYRYDNLMADYESILRKATEFEEAHREAIDIAEENVRLRAELGFRERH